jgi:type IV pilus assembly protein PilM
LTLTGFLLNRAPAPLLGIDISSSSVKLVELNRRRDGRLVLERCALEPLPPGCITDGNVEQFDAVADAMRQAVRQSGTRTRQAALALPSSAVITKRITVAGGLSEPELAAQVEAEANQYIPFALDEVSLDFCALGPASPPAPGVDVLIAASRKERVQDRQALAEAAGLKPVILDIESFASRLAAARIVESLDAQGLPMVALFEVGAHSTGMQVLRGGEVLYDRDQTFGGAQLTQQIARAYGLSPEEAEQRKRLGDLPADYPSTLLRPFVDVMAQDIARALQFFFTSTPHHRVDCVLLAGGCAALPGLAEAVARLTSFACRPADPFAGMRVGPAVHAQSLRQQAPSYLTSCGLALRRFLQ